MKKSKKLLLTLGFLLLGCSFLTAESTASVTLSGTMGDVLEISADAEYVASHLNLSRDQNISNLLVGTVTERTNNPTGYTVTLESSNGFELVNQSNSNRTIAYTLTYGGAEVNSSPSTVTDTNSKPEGSGAEKEVRISYTTGNEYKGDYQDILTFTIANK